MNKDCHCEGQATSAWGRVGAQIGDKAWATGAKLFKNWTGFGDYKIVGNSLMAGGIDNLRISTQGRSTRISYREYLGDIVTSTTVGAFNKRDFIINPGLASTFPWLSPIARQYEQYKAHGIIFEFQTTASDFGGANAQIGSIMMATEYDVQDIDVFSSKAKMMNSAYSQETKMSNNLVAGIECDPSELQRNVFYVRNSQQAFLSDSRDYDVAIFTIATQGGTVAANTSIGSLYVHYDIEFFKEIVNDAVGVPTTIGFSYYVNTDSNSFVSLFNVASGANIPNIPITTIPGKLGEQGFKLTNNNLYIPRAYQNMRLLFTARVRSSNTFTFNTPGTTATFTNCTSVTNIAAPTLCSSWAMSRSGSAQQDCLAQIVIQMNRTITDDFAIIAQANGVEWFPVGGLIPTSIQWTITVVPDDFWQV